MVLAVSMVIYLVGTLRAPKSYRNVDKVSMYACGERVLPRKLRISVTLYRYLIYFVIVDASVMVIAFAALAVELLNPIFLLIYLFINLTSVLFLLGGD